MKNNSFGKALIFSLKPWRSLRFLIDYITEWQLKKHCRAQKGARFLPSSRIKNEQSDPNVINVGVQSWILGELLVFGHAGRIEIGDYCFIGEGTRIWSAAYITIGNRVLISHNVNIHDTNAHSLSAAHRHLQYVEMLTNGHPKELDDVISDGIIIEDDAWIGFNVTILKGVKIGKGAVVGACSLVTGDVLPFTTVVGNPAKPIGFSRD